MSMTPDLPTLLAAAIHEYHETAQNREGRRCQHLTGSPTECEYRRDLYLSQPSGQSIAAAFDAPSERERALTDALYRIYSGEIGFLHPHHPDLLALRQWFDPQRAALAQPDAEEAP